MQSENAKELMAKISYEEIMRELAFERMIERGMEDVRKGRVTSHQEMEHRIRTWQK
jgi:predicted transcriptional regulator